MKKSKTALVLIKQIREEIGVMFGSHETTPGGRALKFYSSCRIDVRRIGQLKDGEEVVGQRVRAKVVKNKVAPPFKQVEFDIMYGEGISKTGELLDLGVKAGVVEKSGRWFSHGGERIGQGRENAKNFLKENKQVALDIEDKIPAAHGLGFENVVRGVAAVIVIGAASSVVSIGESVEGAAIAVGEALAAKRVPVPLAAVVVVVAVVNSSPEPALTIESSPILTSSSSGF